MEPLLTTLMSPDVNLGATLQMWILLPVFAGMAVILWRHHAHKMLDKIQVARAHGFAEGQDLGYAEGKRDGLNRVIYQNWVESGLAAISVVLKGES